MKKMIERIVSFAVDGEALPSFLCTPEHLDELAVGYLLTQGYIESADAVDFVTVEDLSVHARTHTGLLPLRPLEERMAELQPSASDLLIGMDEVKALMEALMEVDSFYGTHCIALKTPDAVYFREDVGRHNAMDKVIGRAAMDGVPFARCIVAATGRISLEMLLKAASVGIPIIISKKYPSDLSAEIAERLGICIIGNALLPSPIAYAGANKIS